MSDSNLERALAVVSGIEKEGGKFIRSGDKVYILFGGRRIPVSPDFENTSYAAIQIKHSKIATAENKGRAICQHVSVLGRERANDMRLAKFSALSKDKSRLYLPVEGEQLLEITANGMTCVPNGANASSIWLEHPQDRAFKFVPKVNVRERLKRFEELCVNTQACNHASHKWLVAMHEGLMPYVRDYVAARMLFEHAGPSQHGKTSGAQRFTKLHGLGDVLGDVSPAYLRNNCDGIGLMVLDNKEQASYSQDLINFLLFTATGARHGRSNQDGSAREVGDRPITVITSIEGLYKQELQKRTVCIPYGALSEKHRDRDYIEEQIDLHRDEMLSSLCHVLRQFLAMSPEDVQGRLDKLPACPRPEFQGYMRVLARLLYAYAVTAEWSQADADQIIGDWFKTLGPASVEREDDVIETHVYQTLELYEAVLAKHDWGGDVSATNGALLKAITRIQDYDHKGEKGTLYVTSASRLLSAMRANNIGLRDLPRNASGMGKRLQSGDWKDLRVLTENDDKELLGRRSKQRLIGIFRSQDDPTDGKVTSPTVANHQIPSGTVYPVVTG